MESVEGDQHQRIWVTFGGYHHCEKKN